MFDMIVLQAPAAPVLIEIPRGGKAGVDLHGIGAGLDLGYRVGAAQNAADTSAARLMRTPNPPALHHFSTEFCNDKRRRAA
jgi:hypothetical protein